MNKLSSQDRSALIRLASSLPAGSPEKRAILEGLKKTASMLHPGPLTSSDGFKKLKPGDQITIHSKPAVVIEYDSFDANLIYAWKGTSVRKFLDAREAWAWEPGEKPGISVSWVGPGEPIANPRRAPRRRVTPTFYD